MTELYEWQKIARGGIKKGEPLVIMSAGRQMGKSYYAARMVAYAQAAARFTGPWSDWKQTKFIWPWDRKLSVEGTKIWGKINTRQHKLALDGGGRIIIQFATDVEIFKRKLKGTGESW
jgi:hypothetical protein